MKSKDSGKANRATDWGDVADWYDQLVGEEGSEYQKHVVFPGALKMLGDVTGQEVLDVACGQGVFSRILNEHGAKVTGVDAALELIRKARQRSDGAVEYLVGDARKLQFLKEARFAAAVCILAIQNIDDLTSVFKGVGRALRVGGRFVVVLMHPCFRGPKYTQWGWDEKERVQYRRIDRYLIQRKEPIFTHPGKKTGEYTWTFHRPMAAYVKSMRSAGLVIDAMEEWTSHKVSTSGPRAAAENMARKEIPMFLAIRAFKSGSMSSADSTHKRMAE